MYPNCLSGKYATNRVLVSIPNYKVLFSANACCSCQQKASGAASYGMKKMLIYAVYSSSLGLRLDHR